MYKSFKTFSLNFIENIHIFILKLRYFPHGAQYADKKNPTVLFRRIFYMLIKTLLNFIINRL